MDDEMVSLIQQHCLSQHLYADDTQIYGASGPSYGQGALLQKITGCLTAVADWMSANRLQLNPDKTEFMFLTSPRSQHRLPTSGPLIGSDVVSPSATVRDLGVFIDQDLAMKTHVQQTASRCFATLRQLRSISRCIPTSVFHSLVSALDRPQQIGLLQQSPDRLASLSHPASPVSPKCRSKAHFNLRRCDHITDALISLHWHRVPEQITFKVATLTYRALHGSAPPYLASSLVIHMCRRHAAPTQAQVRLH